MRPARPPLIHKVASGGATRLWLGLLVFSVVLTVLASYFPWLRTFPKDWALPIPTWINAAATPFFETLRPIGQTIALIVASVLSAIRAVLTALPWPSIVLIVSLIALRARGRGMALFAAAALMAVVALGYWPKAMNTLALVLVVVPASVILGFLFGALADRLPRIQPAMIAVLDVMQTYPAFGYLIPLLLTFGFGVTGGLVASIIFAIPPMVRNTIVGLREVPPAIVESALMAGARPGQLFWQARVPAAMPQLLVGVNQSTMAALSMVIIIAIIGGYNDIGWEVLSAMRSAEMGRSVGAGLVIVLLAIILDRITRGLAEPKAPGTVPAISDRALVAGIALTLAVGLGIRLSGIDLLPGEAGQQFFKRIDSWLLAFVAWSAPFFAVLRNAITYCVMLPMRLGFSGAASPMVWGFKLTPAVMAAYIIVAVAIACLIARRDLRAGIAVGFALLLFWTGLPNFSWIGVFVLTGVATWRTGGWRLLVLALSTLLLAGLTGLWAPMMQSIYLCAVAVMICFIIGGAFGILAAENDRVSAILRPINDALQTMPQFVFLIPALMLFKVGEFTALIAIVLYAIVPPVRYVEHGLRNVSPQLIEATRQLGATRRQMLWQVKLPLARPSIRLGLNQTIMAAISMLVIAALVGTRELGQQVYVALSKADAGAGLVAGWIIAAIALVADRMLRLPDKARPADPEEEAGPDPRTAAPTSERPMNDAARV